MKRRVRQALLRAVTCGALLLVWATPVEAQFVGPNLGATPVSPLYGEQKHRPRPKAAERAKVKRTNARIAKLLPIRKKLESTNDLAKQAEVAKDLFAKRRLLRAAVRRAQSAQRSLDSLRKRWGKDITFSHHADRLAFSLRKDVLKFKRALKQADAAHARATAARKSAPKKSAPEKATPVKKSAAKKRASAGPRSRPSR